MRYGLHVLPRHFGSLSERRVTPAQWLRYPLFIIIAGRSACDCDCMAKHDRMIDLDVQVV